jgi:hypothetical protein
LHRERFAAGKPAANRFPLQFVRRMQFDRNSTTDGAGIFNARARRGREFFPSLRLCSAIYENSAFCAKFSTLCFLCLLLFMLFGCGLPRCDFATLR